MEAMGIDKIIQRLCRMKIKEVLRQDPEKDQYLNARQTQENPRGLNMQKIAGVVDRARDSKKAECKGFKAQV